MTDPRADNEPEGGDQRRPKWQKWAAIAAGIIVLAIIGGAMGSGDTGTTTDDKPANPTKRLNGALAAGGTVRVVDADTIKITDPDTYTVTTVSILGIDAPGSYLSESGTECWGSKAQTWADEKLTASGVTLVLRADKAVPSRNKFGKLQRYVVFKGGGNYSVLAAGAGMVRAAQPSGKAPSKLEEIEAAQQEAKDNNRGLWGPPCEGATQTPEPTYSPTPVPDVNEPDVNNPDVDIDVDRNGSGGVIGNGRDDLPFFPG